MSVPISPKTGSLFYSPIAPVPGLDIQTVKKSANLHKRGAFTALRRLMVVGYARGEGGEECLNTFCRNHRKKGIRLICLLEYRAVVNLCKRDQRTTKANEFAMVPSLSQHIVRIGILLYIGQIRLIAGP